MDGWMDARKERLCFCHDFALIAMKDVWLQDMAGCCWNTFWMMME